jgi:hypothetical protein
MLSASHIYSTTEIELDHSIMGREWSPSVAVQANGDTSSTRVTTPA